MIGRAVSTNIWLLLLEPPRLETCRKTTLAHPITAAKVVEIVTPCRSLRGAPPNCFERDALGRHTRSMPSMPRRGKAIIDRRLLTALFCYCQGIIHFDAGI